MVVMMNTDMKKELNKIKKDFIDGVLMDILLFYGEDRTSPIALKIDDELSPIALKISNILPRYLIQHVANSGSPIYAGELSRIRVFKSLGRLWLETLETGNYEHFAKEFAKSYLPEDSYESEEFIDKMSGLDLSYLIWCEDMKRTLRTRIGSARRARKERKFRDKNREIYSYKHYGYCM